MKNKSDSPEKIETTMLLNDISNFRSDRTKPNYYLDNPVHDNAEKLRASLLEAFKAVHEINNESQKRDSNNLLKQMKGKIFSRNTQSSATQNSALMQEAFAYMHRELTNLLTATGEDRKRINDETFTRKVNEIICKGSAKFPKGELQAPLKKQMEQIKTQVEKCKEPVHKQHLKHP